MTETWFQNQERKPSDFASKKAKFVISPTLVAHLGYGVGRAKDRSEPAFSYLKLGMVAQDPKGNAEPLQVHPLGDLSANADLVALMSRVGLEARKVVLSKARSVLVARTDEGLTLRFYDTPQGMKPIAAGGYLIPPERIDAFVKMLDEATRFIAKYLHLADSDDEKSETEDVFDPGMTIHK